MIVGKVTKCDDSHMRNFKQEPEGMHGSNVDCLTHLSYRPQFSWRGSRRVESLDRKFHRVSRSALMHSLVGTIIRGLRHRIRSLKPCALATNLSAAVHWSSC